MIPLHSFFQINIKYLSFDQYLNSNIEFFLETNNIKFEKSNFYYYPILLSENWNEIKNKLITEYSCISYESYCSFEYYLQAENTDVFNEYKDHMETLLDLFEDSYLLWKKDILEKAFLNKTKFVYEKFISNLQKDSLIKDSSILIDIRYFEVFILKYNDCKYIDWDLISEVEYYPWNVQIIERSIQLNWYKLLENKTTRKIILDSENKKNFKINYMIFLCT